MKRMLLAVLAVCLMAIVSPIAKANVITCAATANVVTAFADGSGNFCTGGGFTSGNFRAASDGFNFVNIALGAALLGDRAQSLQFNITTDPDPVINHGNGSPWLRWYYTVSADDPINNPIQEVGVRSLIGNGILLVETACKSDYQLNYGECPTGDLLGEIYVHPGFTADIDVPMGVDKVYIRKGIYFDDASAFSVENYVGNNAPEPVTLGMIGMGLVGLALLKRRKV